MAHRPAKAGVLELLDDRLVAALARRETFSFATLTAGVEGLPTDPKKLKTMLQRWFAQQLPPSKMSEVRYGRAAGESRREVHRYYPLESPPACITAVHVPVFIDPELPAEPGPPVSADGPEYSEALAFLPEGQCLELKHRLMKQWLLTLDGHSLPVEVQIHRAASLSNQCWPAHEPFFCEELGERLSEVAPWERGDLQPKPVLARIEQVPGGWFGAVVQRERSSVAGGTFDLELWVNGVKAILGLRERG